jgi:hypothetical protein
VDSKKKKEKVKGEKMNKNGYIKNITRFIVMNLVILAGISIANAVVWTDQLDYVPGSTVTISGDNSNDAGYIAEEIVHIDVTGPNGYTSSCSSQVDSSGAWSCQVVLSPDDSAIGDYIYTVVGQNVTESGTFSDSVTSVTITSPTTGDPIIITSLPATVTISFSYTASISGTTTGEAVVLGTSISNTKMLTSGSGSDSIQVTVPTGTTNGNYNAKVTVTNNAGTGANNKNNVQNQAIIVNVPSDTTPPVITPSITGTSGINGWYTSDATVSWTVNDPESTITSTTGCGPTTINVDTTGITLTCSAISVGGTNSQSVVIKRDVTLPRVMAVPDRSTDHNEWYNKPVTISFSGTDSISGVESCDPAVIHSSDTTGISISGNCKDKAGNVGTGSYLLKYDGTVPTITGSRAPSANAYGWNNGDVTVHFECDDLMSGVDSCNDDVKVTTEGSGQSAIGTVTDKAGNSASTTVGDINIDKTPPEITGAPITSPNSKGWYNADIVVHFVTFDALAGIGTSQTDVLLSNEGAGQSATGTVTDKADNSASFTVSGINIDKTAPVVTINIPFDGNVYILNQKVLADWTTTDAISDIASVTGIVASGSPIDTNTIGSKIFKVTATDNADNIVEKIVIYTVQYSQASGRKILQPLQQVSGPSELTKAYKLGNTLPVKFQLSDYNGAFVGTAKVIIAVYKASGTVDLNDPLTVLDSGLSNDNDNIFRYDPAAQQYIYNLNTKNLAVGTFKIVVTLDDDTQIVTYFGLRK